jgi:hypothetical protein
MRDPLQQFDAEPGIRVASPQTADEIMVRLRSLTAELPPLIARLSLRTDDPEDTARILIDDVRRAVEFHVARLLRF